MSSILPNYTRKTKPKIAKQTHLLCLLLLAHGEQLLKTGLLPLEPGHGLLPLSDRSCRHCREPLSPSPVSLLLPPPLLLRIVAPGPIRIVIAPAPALRRTSLLVLPAIPAILLCLLLDRPRRPTTGTILRREIRRGGGGASGRGGGRRGRLGVAPGGEAEAEGGRRGRRRRPARRGGVEERGGGRLLEGREVGCRGGLAERIRRLLVDLWEKTSEELHELGRRGEERRGRAAALAWWRRVSAALSFEEIQPAMAPARANCSGGAGWWIRWARGAVDSGTAGSCSRLAAKSELSEGCSPVFFFFLTSKISFKLRCTLQRAA